MKNIFFLVNILLSTTLFGQMARVVTPEIEIFIKNDSVVDSVMYYTLELTATSDLGLYIYQSDSSKASYTSSSNDIIVGLHKNGYGYNVLDGGEYNLDFLARHKTVRINGRLDLVTSPKEVYLSIDYLVLSRKKKPRLLVVYGRDYNKEARMIYLYFNPSTLIND